MTKIIDGLTEEETLKMVDAIPLITVLIAGADGNIDNEEKAWAAKLTKIRSYATPDKLNAFYLEVGKNYSEKLDRLIASLSNDTEARNAEIAEKLTPLNDILAKLGPELGYQYYNTFVTFAEHVAKSSGGFLRIGAISREEKKLMDLPMLTPIEQPEEEV